MKDKYNAYFKMRELKLFYKAKQSETRKSGIGISSFLYGEKANVVGDCMDILVKEFKLEFEK